MIGNEIVEDNLDASLNSSVKQIKYGQPIKEIRCTQECSETQGSSNNEVFEDHNMADPTAELQVKSTKYVYNIALLY